jgi:predicted transcriptional regulator
MSIIANILDISRGPVLKTQIMYKANLSFTQLQEYLIFLLTTNMIAQTRIEEKEMYRITPEGTNFLRKHSELIHLLNTNIITKEVEIPIKEANKKKQKRTQ